MGSKKRISKTSKMWPFLLESVNEVKLIGPIGSEIAEKESSTVFFIVTNNDLK